MPRVSVIIPVYNGSNFIKQAIESVLKQTYNDYEIIVIDDGSNDHICDVLKPYEHKISYVYQNNQGVAVARNYGIDIAQGELVAFLDQDDLFLPSKLEIQVARFNDQPTLGIVSSGWCTITKQGKWLANIEPWYSLPKLDSEAWIVWKPVLPSALMIHQAWLERVGKFKTQYQQTSDVDLILRLASMQCPSSWVQQVATCYRQHDKNASRQVFQQVNELQTVLNRFFGQANLPQIFLGLEKQSRYQSLVWSAWRLYQNECYSEMAIYLKQSLQFEASPFSKIISSWIQSFANYSSEYGHEFKVDELSNCQAWNRLIDDLVSQRVFPYKLS